MVIAIIMLLGALLLPVLANARKSAKLVQCTSQLSQLGKALIMYSNTNVSAGEIYPHYLTDLYRWAGQIGQNYVPDPRTFVCPMDGTNATGATLKPGNPTNNLGSWVERLASPYNNQANCSYAYEFSGRLCENYDPGTGKFTSSGQFADSYLLAWDLNGKAITTDGNEMNRTSSPGIITWQDAKFWQLNNGDVYISGFSAPGQYGIPNNWSWAPYNWYHGGSGNQPQRNYPRTWMPVIRCFWHCSPAQVDIADTKNQGPEEVLNLSVDCNTFSSVPGWEQTAYKYGRLNSGQ